MMGNSVSQTNWIRCPGPTPMRPRNERPADEIKFRLPCGKTNALSGNGYKVRVKFPDTALNQGAFLISSQRQIHSGPHYREESYWTTVAPEASRPKHSRPKHSRPRHSRPKHKACQFSTNLVLCPRGQVIKVRKHQHYIAKQRGVPAQIPAAERRIRFHGNAWNVRVAD
jgi:hypothetical protein